MIDTARKAAALIGPNQRVRWVVVVGMAVAVSMAEAVSTLAVFALLGAMIGDGTNFSLPAVGDVRRLLPWEGVELVVSLGAFTVAVFLGRSGLVLAQHYLQYRVTENAGARLSARLLSGYLAMPYTFHLQRNSSELIRNAFESVRRFVDEGLIPGVQLLGKFAIVGGVLAVLVMTSPLGTMLAVAAMGPLTWLVFRVTHPRVKLLGQSAHTITERNLQMLQQSLHGVRDITVLGRAATFVDAYRRDRLALARAHYLRRTAAQVPRTAIESVVMVFIVGFVWVAAQAEQGMAEALPVLGLFGYAAARLMPELQVISQGLNAVKFVGPAIDDLHADLSAFKAFNSEFGEERGSVEPLQFTEALRVKRVHYKYPNTATDALVDLNLEIYPGQSVGIIGPTGSGKSTLVDVLLGLLKPTEGQVLVDGIDIHAQPRAWQANLGVVPQTVFLIDDTLKANIAMGVPDAEVDDDSLADAVAMAQLEEFVVSLPNGLDTVVGERGVRVSGGQRQRLVIARALYRKPSVLVFDEATSALDSETERALMSALERLRGQYTVLTVAHRLSTVQNCDTILLVHNGRIADKGSFADLINRYPSLLAIEPVAESP